MPPQFREEEEFELDWDRINAGVSGLAVQYPLTVRGEGEEEEEEEEVPTLPVIFHRVKVQRLGHSRGQPLAITSVSVQRTHTKNR